MTVPAGQEEAFIRSYLVSRALESLNENRAMAEKLAEEFKPDRARRDWTGRKGSGRQVTHPRSGLPKAGGERDEGGGGGTGDPGEAQRGQMEPDHREGRTQSYFAWVDELNAKFKQIEAGKNSALALSPLLASMVYHEQTPSTVGDWAAKLGWEHSTVRKVAQALTWPLSAIVDAVADSGHGAPSWKDSELNKSSSAESDTKVAQEFRTKLDGVQQAISRTIARVTGGDVDYMLELAASAAGYRPTWTTSAPRTRPSKTSTKRCSPPTK